jgi:hypothetical protein
MVVFVRHTTGNYSSSTQHSVAKLCHCLVEPYLQKLLLRETYDQAENQEVNYAEYWVVPRKGATWSGMIQYAVAGQGFQRGRPRKERDEKG